MRTWLFSLPDIYQRLAGEAEGPSSTMSDQAGPSNSAEPSQRRCKRISCFVSKGGVGKTTTCINTAAALVKQGKRVVIIDGDAQCSVTQHLLKSPHEVPEQETLAKKSATKKKRKVSEEHAAAVAADGQAGEEPEPEPPELEPNSPEPEGIFPDSLRDKLATGVQKYDLREVRDDLPTIFYYLNAQILFNEPKLHLPEIELPGSGSGRLWLVPGAPLINMLDTTLNQAAYSDSMDSGGKLACWLRLFQTIERQYNTDYIFVDLNPAACILNYLAMLSSDFILPAVTTALYDVRACETFLGSFISDMFTLAQKRILEPQRGHAAKDPRSASDQKRKGSWFPCRAPKQRGAALAETVPRMPKILPFLVQRYKFNSNTVLTLPASKWCLTLQQIVLEAAQRLNIIPGAGAGDGKHPHRSLREMIYFNQEHIGRIDDFEKAAAMVIPWVAAMEPIIALSQSLRKPIEFLTHADIKAAVVGKEDRKSKIKWLTYAQRKYGGLARSLDQLDIGPDFYYG